MNYNVAEMTVDELKALAEAVKAELKTKRADLKENLAAVKAERDAEMRAKVKEGDKIAFTFNKAEAEGKVVKVSEKSVTVEFDLNGETVKRYRKYSDILKVVE